VLSLVLVARTVEHRAGRAPKSVAVLPFKSLGVEVDDQHLGLGMADTLGVRLSSIKQLIVRPTSAVRKYTDANQDPLKAGREQEVEAVLEGTIHRAKGRIRVTARLLRVEDGVSLWAGSLDDKDEDIFTLQDSIVEKLAGALAVNLTGDERQSLSRHHTESLGAYRAYLKGRHFWNRRTEEGLKTAIGYFNQAIAEDPAYALAYGGLADCYKVLGRYGWLAPEEGFSKAREAVTKALSIDNQSAEIHATLATLLISYDYREHAQAEREFRRAIALNPNYATAHQWYAEYLSPLGRHEEALAEIRRAYELDPVSPIVSAGLAGVLYHARQYDQAIEQSLKTLELDTKLANATRVLSAAYQAQGRFDQAIRVLEDALESSPDQRECLGELGHAYAMVGRRGEARRIIERLREGSTRRHGVAYWVALTHAGLRDKAQALAWLEEAHRERSMGGAANTIGVEPRFDGLRSDSRFADLLRSAGLAS